MCFFLIVDVKVVAPRPAGETILPCYSTSSGHNGGGGSSNGDGNGNGGSSNDGPDYSRRDEKRGFSYAAPEPGEDLPQYTPTSEE